MDTPQERPGRVAILLSSFNGATFLRAQLASIVAQTYGDWQVVWRDDGSDDATCAIMEEWAVLHPVRRLAGTARLGASRSFLLLLAAADADFVAFCDQDDEWLPDKLARAVAALAGIAGPALLCGRQILMDAAGQPIGLSTPPVRDLSFANAMVQNMAVGCTIVMNRAAARAVSMVRAPDAGWHDWWCCLRVSGVGGVVIFDPVPVVRYRQHGGNLVGTRGGNLARTWRAWRRGGRVFLQALAAQTAALAACCDLTPAAQDLLREWQGLRAGCFATRLWALHRTGVYRQAGVDNFLLYGLFLWHRLPSR